MNIYIQLFGFKFDMNRMGASQFDKINYTHNFGDQLDAQFFYFIIRLLQSSTCFEQRRAHHQEIKFF